MITAPELNIITRLARKDQEEKKKLHEMEKYNQHLTRCQIAINLCETRIQKIIIAAANNGQNTASFYIRKNRFNTDEEECFILDENKHRYADGRSSWYRDSEYFNLDTMILYLQKIGISMDFQQEKMWQHGCGSFIGYKVILKW